MKFFVLFICLVPLTLTAQSVKDYENAMAMFQKFYNKGQGDSIEAMLAPGPVEMQSVHFWSNSNTADALKEFGKLNSFKFIGIDDTDPEKVTVFRTVFSKAGEGATSLTLVKGNVIGTFRLRTGSERIDALLKKSKNNR